MDRITIYVEMSGGRWEARYWHTDEGRYFRYYDHDRDVAIKRCVEATGYDMDNADIVSC